jgi:hypothetical protein
MVFEKKLRCLFVELKCTNLMKLLENGRVNLAARPAKSTSFAGFFLSNFLLDLTLHLWQIERRKKGGTDCLKGRQVEAARCWFDRSRTAEKSAYRAHQDRQSLAQRV